MSSEDIALDQIYVGHDRVLVNTCEIAPGYYVTIVIGPGARPEDTETTRRSYASEEAAMAGHDAVLASYGYRKTGLRKWKIFRQLANLGKSLVNVSRRPPSRRSAWIMTSCWTVACLMVTSSIVGNGGFNFTGWAGWTNLMIGTFDAVMIYQSVLGLWWIYHRPADATLAG